MSTQVLRRVPRRLPVGAVIMLAGATLVAITGSASPAAALAPVSGVVIEIGSDSSQGSAADFVVDASAGLVYVSRRTAEDIKVVSLTLGEIVDTFTMPGMPVGLELSDDGGLLYVALNDDGSVVSVDTSTGVVQDTFDIEAELGDYRAWELQRVGTKLYVSGNPGSYGLAYIVEIDLVAETARRVAPYHPEQFEDLYTIIRAAPEFAWDGGDYLYVGEGFSPNSLYQLDLTDPDVPIALEDDHGSVAGTQRLAATPGAIAVGSGDILDPADFSVLADLSPSYPAWSDDGSYLYLLVADDGAEMSIERYDGASLAQGTTMATACGTFGDWATVAYIDHFAALPDDAGFLVLGDGKLCLIPPYPAEIGTCGGEIPTIIGTDGPDVIEGTPGDDVISTYGGDDTVDGAGGADTICGGPNADTIVGGAGNDDLYGDAGNDTLVGGPDDDQFHGGSGTDTVSFEGAAGPIVATLGGGTATGEGADQFDLVENLIGSPFDDDLVGDAGPNSIEGRAGNDLLTGGGGPDTLNGGDGDDVASGGSGGDSIVGGNGADLLVGGGGNDVIDGGRGSDEILGGGGRDRLSGGGQDDEIFGQGGKDVLRGDSGDDYLDGGGANDRLTGGSGEDYLFGGAKHDKLNGGGGFDWLEGGPGDDTLNGGKKIDAAVFANAGQGVVVDLAAGTAVGEGQDTLSSIGSVVGSEFADTITGTAGFNGLIGLGGADTIHGMSGGDNVIGNEGNDHLYGEDGDDFLDGGAGTDMLNGGAGYDICLDGEQRYGCDQLHINSIVLDRSRPASPDRLESLKPLLSRLEGSDA